MAGFARDIEDVVNIREGFGVNVEHVRHVRPRKDPFEEYSDREFRNRYRLTKDAVHFVIDLVRGDLEHLSDQALNISPALQVLVTLRYFAKGCYQTELGDLHGISQPSVSRIVHRVSRAIAGVLPRFVHWPQDIERVKQDFYDVAHFPNIVGCVDCTHIKIKNPDGSRPLLYCNRKGFYSVNVQVVCDATSRITHIVARWRGSVHDSRIWNNCTLKDDFEHGRKTGILLGDSGYACTPYMLTPLLNTHNAAEEAYNRAHKATRVTVECCFGRWKSMFRALQNNMQVSLDTAKACISAIAVLYNIKLSYDDNFECDDNEDIEDEEPVEEEVVVAEQMGGNLFRQQFIRQHFQR
ncbi:hypothetical protein Zmor_000860 [Zophobas morio]|uniref:Putative nuclease HARBI1 n=1 Tax=Zophobas morio TaxID=2755281 RepID=A0AA38MS50_9CUCU|nr:hypothetical protein Zmor_000860 [Zophobas morio]